MRPKTPLARGLAWLACGRRATASGLALAVVALSAFADDNDGGGDATHPELYRWLDRSGVVRYTPNLDRIPDTRRKTAIKVVPGTTPLGEALGAQVGQPLNSPAAAGTGAPSTVPSLAGADPFNDPTERRRVDGERLAPDTALGNSWPELDARIAELEMLIAADEEIIKEMLSAPPTGEYDELIHSPVLRQVASRLPILQGELIELRRWREQPRDR